MSKVIQKDPFGDGFWCLVQLDSGATQLVHTSDGKGYKAAEPSDAALIALATKAEAAQTAATIEAAKPLTACPACGKAYTTVTKGVV